MQTSLSPQSTRASNMEKRRARILVRAQETLSRQGFEALTVRDLAKQAGVTVPTIYNLIGNKNAILRTLIEGMVLRCESVFDASEHEDPLVRTESVVTSLADLFSEQEDFCRAALLAGVHIDSEDADPTQTGLLARCAEIAMEICRDARSRGLLVGAIDTETLGERAFDSYRIAVFDWLHGVLDADGFRANALVGFFVCLASDATPEFRAQLTERIASLNGGSPRSGRKRRSTKKEKTHAPK